jgi:endoglucanase
LHTDKNLIKDANGKTIILRGVSLIDIGALYAWGATSSPLSATGITQTIDKVISVGMQPHAIRLPVYPRSVRNPNPWNNDESLWPAYSPVPFPVGAAAPSGKTKWEPTADEYYSKVLKPAVDYVTAKGLYAIIDFHQIDHANAQTVADAVTFWTAIAPKFKDASNVIFEAFNEPINSGPTLTTAAASWANYKPFAEQMVKAIRDAAPSNLIILGSPSWCQMPGEMVASPVSGTNIVLTAHIYPENWTQQAFKTSVDKALTAYPVFVSEWGWRDDSSCNANAAPSGVCAGNQSATWGSSLRTTLDGNGASWTAWVFDSQWEPMMLKQDSTLTNFGTLVKDWLGAKATSDWIK